MSSKKSKKCVTVVQPHLNPSSLSKYTIVCTGVSAPHPPTPQPQKENRPSFLSRTPLNPQILQVPFFR